MSPSPFTISVLHFWFRIGLAPYDKKSEPASIIYLGKI
jgi:hypothetical protein